MKDSARREACQIIFHCHAQPWNKYLFFLFSWTEAGIWVEAYLVQQADLNEGLVVEVDEEGPIVGQLGKGNLPHPKVALHRVHGLLWGSTPNTCLRPFVFCLTASRCHCKSRPGEHLHCTDAFSRAD